MPSAYRRRVSSSRSTALDVAIYTILRVLLFVVVFLIIQFLTPIHGVWAAVAALLISGAISVIALDRQRNKVGQAFGRFFGRINERIDASASAEDEALDRAESASGQGQQDSQHDAVDQQ